MIEEKDYYLVGQVRNFDTKHWEFAGLYSTEELAIERCLNNTFFVAKVTLDEYIPNETVSFEYAYYPKA